jgi:hypothetical protein
MSTTYPQAQSSVDRLADMVATNLQGQATQTGQRSTGAPAAVPTQPVADEQRFLGTLLDIAVNHVLPVAVQGVQKLVADRRRAYNIPEQRDMDEMQRGILDFIKNALPDVLTTVSTVAQQFARPRQRGGATDEATERFLPFLLPIISAVAPAAINAISNAISGQRGPVSINNEDDQRFLFDFVKETVTNCFQPGVLNPMIAKLQALGTQAPSGQQQPGTPQRQPAPTW